MENHSQTDLFETPDDSYEAMRILIMRLGGPKKMGKKLWPEKPMEAAAILLNNCLNRERPEKLDLDQIDFLIGEGRKVGCHIVMQCFAVRHAYRVTAIELEDERIRLQREFIETGRRMEALISQLNELPAP